MNHQWLLIVDEEEPQRRLLQGILGAEGFQCHTAADAAQGRQQLKQHSFDLILSEMHLPDDSGLAFINFVKKVYPQTGIVIVSISSQPEVSRAALEAGICGYILKPFHQNQVVITVQNALLLAASEIRARNRATELDQLVSERTTELMAMQERLQRLDMKLKSQKQALERAQVALQAVMDCRLRDRAETEATILINVRQALQPYLEKLRRSQLTDRQTQCLDILETRIQDIVSPFIRALSSAFINLSPTELQVAQLIKEGRSTKEIAAILNLSANTVMTHRYKIRTKLGLKNQRQNLHVFLKSFTNQ